MASNTRVINLTSGCRIKRSQARNRVEQCLSVWIDDGFTIRDLSLAERVTARKEQAKLEEGLFYYVQGKDGKLIAKPYLAELHGLKYEPSMQNQASTRLSYAILKQANAFAYASSN